MRCAGYVDMQLHVRFQPQSLNVYIIRTYVGIHIILQITHVISLRLNDWNDRFAVFCVFPTLSDIMNTALTKVKLVSFVINVVQLLCKNMFLSSFFCRVTLIEKCGCGKFMC